MQNESKEPEPASELPPEVAAVLSDELVEEIRLLSKMPQVRLRNNSIFDRAKPPGSRAQQRGVIVSLRCCKVPLDSKCNDWTDERALPSHIEAARALRHKVQLKHGSEACLEKARLALAEEASADGAPSSYAPPEHAFTVLLGKQLAIQKAQRRVKAAEKAESEFAEKAIYAAALHKTAQAELEEVCRPAP